MIQQYLNTTARFFNSREEPQEIITAIIIISMKDNWDPILDLISSNSGSGEPKLTHILGLTKTSATTMTAV